MKPTISLLSLALLLSGCSVFKLPSQPANAPTALSGSYPDKTQEWAAAKLAEARKADQERFEKALTKIDSERSSR